MKDQNDLVFIVTCIDDKYINNMVSSVLEGNDIVNLFVVFVNQTGKEYNYASNEMTYIKEVNVSKMSLSKARNIGIDYLFKNDILFDHIMFPDDDSSFSVDFFVNFKKSVDNNKNYLINVFNKGSSKLYKKMPFSNGYKLHKNDYNYAMSVNMIVTYNTIVKIGGFDMNLGVGAKYGAAEDADFYVNSCNYSNFYYNNELHNYHPANISKFNDMTYEQLINRFKKYSEGNIYFLYKHNFVSAYYKLLVRAIIVSIYYLLTLNIKLFKVYVYIFFYRISFKRALKFELK